MKPSAISKYGDTLDLILFYKGSKVRLASLLKMNVHADVYSEVEVFKKNYLKHYLRTNFSRNSDSGQNISQFLKR